MRLHQHHLGSAAYLVHPSELSPADGSHSGCDYNIVDLSPRANPAVLANVKAVRQRLFLRDTGTLFLLNDQGLTVVRQPQVELEHAAELIELSHN